MVRPIYVTQAGRVINFADNATDDQIQAYVQQNFPAQPEAQAPAQPKYSDAGLGSFLTTGFTESYTDIPGGISGLATADDTALTRASDYAKKTAREAVGIKEGEEWTIPQYAAYLTGQVGGFLVPAAGEAAAGAKILSGVGKLANLARGIGAVTEAASGAEKLSMGAKAALAVPSLVQTGAVQANAAREQINQQRADGMVISPEQQLLTQRMNFAIGLAERVPLERFAGPLTGLLSKVPAKYAPVAEKIIASRLSRVAGTSFAEASQEVLSGIASDLVEYGVYNPNVQIGQDIVSNAAGGGFAGGMVEGILQVAAGRRAGRANQLQADVQREAEEGRAQARRAEIEAGVKAMVDNKVSGLLDVKAYTVNKTPGDPNSPKITIRELSHKGTPVSLFTDMSVAQEAVNEYKKRTNADIKIATGKVDDYFGAQPKVQVKDTPAFEGTSRLGDRLRTRQEEAPFKGGLSATIKQGENVDKAQPVGDKFLLPDQIRSQYESLSGNQTERNAILKTPERLEANAMNIGIDPNELKIALTEQNKADAPTIKQLKPLYNDIASRAQQNVATPTADPLSSLNPESNDLSMASTVSLKGEPLKTLFPKRKGVSYETLNKFTSGTKFEPLTPEQVETFQNTPPEYEASYELPAQPGTTQAAATDVNADLNETPKGAPEWQGVDTLSPPIMEPGSGDTSTVINKPGNRPVPKVTKEYEARAQKMSQVLGDSVDARVKALNMPFVAARLRDYISGKTVTDVPNAENIPDALRDRRTPRGMATTISPEKVLIDLATSVWGPDISVEDMTKKVIETLNHEIIHAVYGVNALTPTEQRILSKAVRSTKMLGKKYTYLDMAQASYGPTFQKSVNDGTMTQAEADAAVEEEAVAEMFREWSKNPKAAPQQAKGLLNRILHFIRALFNGLKSASHHDVFRKIESGEVGKRPRGNPKMSPSRFAIPPEYLRNNINYVETPEEGKNKTENFIPDNMDAAKSVKAYRRLDEARRMFPNPLANPAVWTDNLSYAYNKADGTLMPPVWASRMANDVNSWATWQKGLTADQLSGVDDGFSSIDQIGAEYANGNATPEFTGTLLFWTYLSRMQSSFPHESGFLDMAETVQPFITKAVNGTFTADPTLIALTATNSKALKTARGFAENALPHEMAVPGRSDLDDYFIATRAALPIDSPGQSATSNINSFGRDFLAKMSEKAPGEDISKLRAVHNLFADRRLSGPEVRRQFHRIRDDASLGFDNKILSFAILLSGRKDVLIMDRIQINQMFGGGQTNKIYDDIHSLFDGPRGLAVYEALERGLTLKMNDLYTAVGRPQDASLGRYHWESWIRSSGQIVAHPTLQALVNLARGTANPFLGVASAEGRYHRGMFGVQYMRMPNGKSEFIYTTQDGNEYAIPKNQLDEILDWDKLRKRGAIPPWFPGVSTFEGGVSSWRDYPGVNINLVDSEVARNGVLIRNGRANQANGQPANAAQAANAARLARIRTAYDASNRARWDFGRRPVDGKPHARIPESYERTDRGLASGNVARYEAKDGVKSIFGQAKVSAPDFLELAPTPENAAKFHAAISAAKAENTHGAAVYLYEEAEYANMRLFLTEDGGAGFALKGDDIVSVFNSKSSPHRAVSIPALHLAIQLGGRKLDGFDTVLPGLYQQSGMGVVSRTKFADLNNIRPVGWSPQTFAEFNGGYPDVVYMVFDPTNWAMYKPTDGALFTSRLDDPYDAAEEAYNLATAAQSAAVYVEPEAKPKAPRKGKDPKFAIAPPKNASILSQTKAVDKNGNPVLFYHGTVVGPFKSFRTPSFFTENPDEAGAYTHWNVLASREKALGKPKYKVIQGQAGITETVVPYVGIISDIPYEDRGKIYATDDGVVRKNADGTVDLFSGWVVDYDGSSGLDPDTARIERGDGSAVQTIVDDYRDFIDRNFPEGEGVGGRIAPVYLNIKNPIEIPVFEANRLGARLGAMTPEQIERYIDDLRAKGYDGIATYSDTATIYPDIAYELGGVPRQFIPFSEDQVISAFDERLTGVSPAPDAPTPKFSVSPEHQEVQSTAYVEQMRPNVYKVDVQEGLLTRFVKGMFGEGHRQGTFMEALRQNLVDRRSRIKDFEGDMQGSEELSGYISMEFADRAGHFGFAAATEGPPVLDMSNNDPDTMTVRISESPDNIKNIYELLTDGPLGPDGKKQSLGNVFFDYAIAKRGSVLEDDGFETPLDDQFIADAIRVGESNPKVMEAYAMYQRYNKRLMEAALNSGAITQEQFNKFTGDMNYFSFYREFGDLAQVPGVGTKMANDWGIVPYRGSKLGNLINDPILMMVNNTVFWTAAIMKTVAVRKTFKNLNAMGEARILAPGEQIPAGWQPEVMYYKDRGETHPFVVKDYLLAQALGSNETFDAPGWLKLLGLPTKGLREAITRDPVFIARNLMRDTISAWGLTGENIIPVIDTLKGMKKALLNDTSMRSLMLRGVTGGYDEASRGAEGITNFIKNQSAMKRPKIEYLTDPKQIRDVIWRGLGRISDASDAATRIAVYDRAREQGASEYAAAYRALKIMNFSRQGRWSGIRYLTALYPFINARIQGTDLWMRSIAAGGRTLVGKGSMEDATMGVNVGKSLLVRGAMMAALSWLLEAYNSQDEKYLGTEDYIKDSNLLIPTFGLFGPDGPDYWAWPQAFEFGLIFSTIPRHIYQHMAGRGEARKDVNLFTAQFASTFGLNPTPQIINPIYEVLYNKSFFTAQPVVSEGMARLDPSLQYTDKTSSLARMLGETPLNYDPVSGQMKGFSPAVIDHLIKGYGGPMGAYLLVAADVVANGVNIGPPRLPNTSITEVPIIRSFLIDTKTRNPQAKADAYELYQMVDEVNRTSSRLKAMGDVEAYMQYRQENLPIIQRKKQVMSMVKSLNDLQARRRMLERNKTMTEDEKIAEIKRLRDLEVRLTARVGELNAALR